MLMRQALCRGCTLPASPAGTAALHHLGHTLSALVATATPPPEPPSSAGGASAGPPGAAVAADKAAQEEFGFGFIRSNVLPPKPRSTGLTEMRGPYYTPMGERYLRDVLEGMGHAVDGLKFAGEASSF